MVSKNGLYKHRIVPGHMSGTYEPSNVVLLTIRQHAEAHKKLYKQHGKREDWIAWKTLCGQIAKKKLSIELEKLRRENISKAQKGRTLSVETKRKISDSNRGKPKSLEHRASLSAARMGKSPWNKGKPWSAESRQKMRLAKLGKVRGQYRKLTHEVKESNGI